MGLFEYKAKDQEGNTVAGIVEAPTENVALEILEDKNLFLLSMNERRQFTFFQATLSFLKRVPRREIIIFARQLAVMISATVPIVQALRILVKQTSNTTFKIIISELADEVEGGAKLSTSLARYPQIFSGFFIHLIRSGETTGKLDETLNYLADEQEKDYDLMSKIKGAMYYPIFIVVAMVVLGVVLMIFVIPKLTAILQESGVDLPLTTKILIGTSDLLKNFWWLILLLVIGGYFGYRFISHTDWGRHKIDAYKFKIPIFGQIFEKIALVRFARSFSTLIVSGIPITKALEIVADIAGNVIYHDLTLETIKAVESGKSISSVFLKSKIIPPMLPHMMAVGEQTGKLDVVLEKISDFYGRELANMINNLVSLIEPVIMVVLGLAVGLIVAGVMLPMYQLAQSGA